MVSQRDGGSENSPGTAGPEEKKKENKESRKDGGTTEGWGAAERWESSDISRACERCSSLLLLPVFRGYLCLHVIPVLSGCFPPTRSIREESGSSAVWTASSCTTSSQDSNPSPSFSSSTLRSAQVETIAPSSFHALVYQLAVVPGVWMVEFKVFKLLLFTGCVSALWRLWCFVVPDYICLLERQLAANGSLRTEDAQTDIKGQLCWECIYGWLQRFRKLI